MPPITKARKKTILRHCSHSGLHYPRLIPFLFSSVNEISCRSGALWTDGRTLQIRGMRGRKGITRPSCRGAWCILQVLGPAIISSIQFISKGSPFHQGNNSTQSWDPAADEKRVGVGLCALTGGFSLPPPAWMSLRGRGTHTLVAVLGPHNHLGATAWIQREIKVKFGKLSSLPALLCGRGFAIENIIALKFQISQGSYNIINILPNIINNKK